MANICVFGDSIVWGASDTTGGGWVGRLRNAAYEHRSVSTVYNCGIPGNKVADVIKRVDIESEAREPDLSVLAIGINDIPHYGYPGTNVLDFLRQYEELLIRAQLHANGLILVTPTNVDESRSGHGYLNIDIATIADIIKSLAAKHDLKAVDVHGSMTSLDLSPDGLHPGAEGHHKLFDAIRPVVFEAVQSL